MKNRIKQIKEMYNISGYHKQFIILFIIIVGTEILEIISVPYIIKQIVDIYIPSSNIKALIIWGFIYIIFLALSYYLILKHCSIRAILKRKIQRDLREKVFIKMQEIKTRFYDENDTGVILQFLQTDVNESGAMFAEVVTEMVFMGLIRFSIIAIFLMFIDLKIALIILALYIIGYLVTIFFNKKTISIINKIRLINIELYNKMSEGIQGFLTIKILNIIKQKEEELKEILKEYDLTNNKLEKNISTYNNIFAFIVSLSTVIIIYFGGMEVVQGVMAYVEIMLLIQYSGSLEFHFKWIIKHLTNFNKSFVSFSKILNFLELDNVENIQNGKEVERIESIEFLNVSFSYTGYEKNIDDFSFELRNNKKIAFVGRTGSGKTTVVNLLCRFYEPMSGEIKINGINYLEYSMASLRKRIGYVMQETYIVPNTIIDNTKYVNKDITDEEIKSIFIKLKMHEKIMKLKDGYNTDIRNNPDILSTGERQMINFARVMAIDCDVVILDEVTSALSYEAEMLVNNAINEATKGKIAIIIAHRLSTIKNCDKIILMKNGKQIEEGNHKELIDRKKEYYELYRKGCIK